MNRHQRILLDCGVQHSVTVKQRVDTFKKTGRLPILNRYTEPGRNDPCPCESGKKYKHCCIDKNRRNVGVANFIANQ